MFPAYRAVFQKKSKHSPDFNTNDYNETRVKVQFTENVFCGRISKNNSEVKKNGNYKMGFTGCHSSYTRTPDYCIYKKYKNNEKNLRMPYHAFFRHADFTAYFKLSARFPSPA